MKITLKLLEGFIDSLSKEFGSETRLALRQETLSSGGWWPGVDGPTTWLVMDVSRYPEPLDGRLYREAIPSGDVALKKLKGWLLCLGHKGAHIGPDGLRVWNAKE